MLNNGLKFDLWIYVLLYGVDPLRIFLYKEGLCWFATEPYQAPTKKNMNNMFIHLTNYSINKMSKNFTQPEDEKGSAHKKSLTQIYSELAEQGHDVSRLKA